MQRLDVDNDFNAICNLFTDFDPILALDFASLDFLKISCRPTILVCVKPALY